MDRKPVLEVHVEMMDKTVRMQSETGEVVMIPFRGQVRGELFSGIVEPCGVDTQVVNQNGVRHMSARYMLTGKDADGQEAHIYVENNGWFPDPLPKPFHTVPTFITDSKRLAPYLHRNQFEGIGQTEADGLWIRFYEIER